MKKYLPIFLVLSLFLSTSCHKKEKPVPQNNNFWKNLKLVWVDSFDSFSNNIWTKANLATHGTEPQLYLTNNVTCKNGHLVITLKNKPFTCPDSPKRTTWACGLGKPGKIYPYTSGWVETNAQHYVHYGYIEARVKMAYGYGFWPAFWTWRGENVHAANATEIDIFEMLGWDSPNEIHTNVHMAYTPGAKSYPKTLRPNGFSWDDEWHTYGMDWTPDTLSWYVDGKRVRRLKNPGIITPARIILNFAIDGGHLPKPNTPFPAKMWVDYVKVYRHK